MNRTHARQKSHSPSNTSVGLVSVADVLRVLSSLKMIGLHVFTVVLVVIMVNLGFWQLRRHEERVTFNDAVRARAMQAPRPPDELLALDADPANLEWYPLAATGEYLVGEDLLLVNVSQDGRAGVDPVSALRLDDGTILLVNRGFVPLATRPDSPVPPAPVTAVGYLRVTQTRGTLGAVDSTDPATVEFQRIDVPLIARKFGGTVFPLYLQLIAETPSAGAEWPAPVSFPELSEGSHKSYVFQWSFFSLVACAGWVVVVRRKWRAGAPVSGSPGQTSA